MRIQGLNRRQILKRMTQLFGAAFATPLVNGVLAGTAGLQIPAGQGGIALAPAEVRFIGIVADLIIPRTTTPSASEAGVVGFIDRIIGEYENEGGRRKFKRGLKGFYALADKELGGCFVSSSAADQSAWVELFDGNSFARKAGAEGSFYIGLKKLIVTGYYVSEPGASEELAYLGIPGHFQGDIPVTDYTRAWAD